MTSEGGEGPKTNAPGGPAQPPTTLTGQHRALDEAAAQLVAAWDVDIDAHAPDQGYDAPESPAPAAGPSSTRSSTRQLSPTPSMPQPAAAPPVVTTPRRWPWFAAGAAVLAGVALLVTTGSDTPSVTPHAAQQPTAAVAQPAPPQPAPAQPAPAPAPTAAPVVETLPTQHRLTIRTIPKGAVLKIAGQRVDNPYRGKHAGGDTLEIEATAAGHQQATRELELTEDTHLMVTLVPEEPDTAKAPSAAVKQRRAAAARKKARRRAQARKRAKARSRSSKARRKPAAPKERSGGSAGFVSSNPYQ